MALNGVGGLASGAEMRWSMVKPEAGTIDGSGVFVAGTDRGIYTEAVRVEAVVPGEQGVVRAYDFASVVIREQDSSRRLESLRVLPESVVLGPQGVTLLAAHTVDEFGNPADDPIISWEMMSEGVGEIDDYGSFRAGNHPGIYPDALQVTAWQFSEHGILVLRVTVDVTITGALAELEIRPTLATLEPGRTNHFRVTGRDENGADLLGLLVLWSVPDGRAGTIDSFGNFTAGDEPGLYPDAVSVEVIQTLPGDP